MTCRYAFAGLTLAFFGGLVAPVWAQEADATDKAASGAVPAKAAPAPSADLTVTTLPGGVRLVVLREPQSSVVVTDVFFNVNRADERGHPGINALIARMWGVESEWRGAALTRRDINQIGAAGTDVGDDWVEIWSVSGTQEVDIADSLRTLLTNLVANPRFSQETLETAKEEQEQERALSTDLLWTDGLDHLRERVWGMSPFALPLLGTEASLRGLTAEQMTRYYTERFRPERAVICIAGPVDPDAIARKVRSALGAGDWLNRPSAPPVPLATPARIPPGLRDFQLGRAAPSVALMTGFTAPGTRDRSAYATWLLLDAALTGGKSSRLFQTLRDGTDDRYALPLGYDIRSVMQAGQTQSLWAVYVVGTADAPVARPRLLEALRAVASDKPLSDDEINRARQWLKVRHARERQRPRDRAAGVGWSEMMGLGAAYDLDFDKTLDALSADDVRSLAARLLSAPSAVVYNTLAAPAASDAPVPTLPRETAPATGASTP